MPTAHKRSWIGALHAAGLREIEVGSFVPAKLLPQMADAAEVVRHALTHAGPDGDGAGAQPARRARRALEAGVHKLTMPVSASDAHSLANVRKTREQMVEEVRAVVALRHERAPGVKVEVGVSTAFGCTLQGAVPEDDVIRAGRSAGGGRRRRRGPVRHHRHGQPGAGAAPVHAAARPKSASVPAPRTCTTRAASAWPTASPPTTWACAPSTLAGRPRRLPLCAGRVGQRRHRGPGVHVREPWACDTGIDLDKLLAAREPLRAGAARRADLRHDARSRPAPKGALQ